MVHHKIFLHFQNKILRFGLLLANDCLTRKCWMHVCFKFYYDIQMKNGENKFDNQFSRHIVSLMSLRENVRGHLIYHKYKFSCYLCSTNTYNIFIYPSSPLFSSLLINSVRLLSSSKFKLYFLLSRIVTFSACM